MTPRRTSSKRLQSLVGSPGMRTVGWLALVLVLAGCADPPAPPVGLPVDDQGRVLPTVEGFVVDDAIRPMQGAIVRVLSEELTAETDAEGHYAILRPTDAAQTILVSASAPGYQPLAKQMQASRYTSERLDFRLEPDPYQAPHTEVLQERGSLGCEVHAQVVGIGHALTCDSPNLLDPQLQSPPTVWDINPTPGFAGIVVEIYWQAQSSLVRDLHAVLRAPMVGGLAAAPGEVQAEAFGPSPLRLEIPEEAARSLNRWTGVRLELTVPHTQGDLPAAFSFDQTFDAYATLFYVDPAPPGYRLA